MSLEWKNQHGRLKFALESSKSPILIRQPVSKSLCLAIYDDVRIASWGILCRSYSFCVKPLPQMRNAVDLALVNISSHKLQFYNCKEKNGVWRKKRRKLM